jgi:hypothetical protein
VSKQTDFEYGYNLPESDYSTNDPPTYARECFGLLVCPHCGRSIMCNDISPKGDEMIPRGNSQQQQSQQANNQNRRTNGFPWMKPEMLTTDKQPGLICAARMEDDNFRKGQKMLLCKVEYQRQYYRFSLRMNNPVLDQLCSSFGDDETRWNNLPVFIFKEVDAHDGREWIRIEARAEEPTSVPVVASRRKQS